MTKTRICVVCLEQYEAEIPKPLEAKLIVTEIDRKEKTATFSSNWPTDSIPFTEEEQEGIKAGPPIKYKKWKLINKRTSQSFLLVEGKRIECGFCLKCLERLK